MILGGWGINELVSECLQKVMFFVCQIHTASKHKNIVLVHRIDKLVQNHSSK